jgi:predicted alpha/beta hydrolase
MVGSQSGYLGNWNFFSQLILIPFWWIMVPGITKLKDYFPAHWFRLGNPLPKGIALEWASWCRHPEYLLGHISNEILLRYQRFNAKVLAYSFSDDLIAPKKAVEALFRFYPKASITHKHLLPKHLGFSYVGHFGFFREKFIDSLWAQSLVWLRN